MKSEKTFVPAALSRWKRKANRIFRRFKVSQAFRFFLLVFRLSFFFAFLRCSFFFTLTSPLDDVFLGARWLLDQHFFDFFGGNVRKWLSLGKKKKATRFFLTGLGCHCHVVAGSVQGQPHHEAVWFASLTNSRRKRINFYFPFSPPPPV